MPSEQTLLSNFEILRRGGPVKDGMTISGLLPDAELPLGKPMMYATSNVDTAKKTFVVAEGRCDGFLTRNVRTAAQGIRTDEELAFGFNAWEVSAFLGGREGSIDPTPEELIVEGADYVDQGAGAGQITIDTGAGQDGALLSFEAGKFHVAVATDFAQFRLVKKLTPNDAANVRIHVARVASAQAVV